MNFDDWRPVDRNTRQYLKDLEAWVDEFMPWSITGGVYEPELILPPTFQEQAALEAAELIARRMITGLAVTNARSWRAAASQSLKGRRIYAGLRTEMGGPVGMRVDELVRQQVQLIRSIPQSVARRAAAFIGAEQRRGVRSESIVNALRAKLPATAYSQVKTLARTEVGRAETALTRARSERLGLAWYEWATSRDKRVRLSHRKMDSVLVAWADPPSPELLAGERSQGHYHAGSIYNCRCIALPLVDLSEVRWPHRVFAHGKVEYVNRSQFERWIRLPDAA